MEICGLEKVQAVVGTSSDEVPTPCAPPTPAEPIHLDQCGVGHRSDFREGNELGVVGESDELVELGGDWAVVSSGGVAVV